MAYAEKTKVSVDATLTEIKRLLQKHGAASFIHAEEGNRATLAFKMNDRMIRFRLLLPEQAPFMTYKQGSSVFRRADGVGEKMWEQACRAKWRALLLVIKAKLEAIAEEITTFEDEFLAHTVLADGSTVGDFVKPMVEENYRVGGAPQLLLPSPKKR